MSKDNPSSLLSPKYILIDMMVNEGMTTAELLQKTRNQDFYRFLVYNDPLTPEMALQLEGIFSLPASFWITLEESYRESLPKLQDDQKKIEKSGQDTNQA